MNESTSESIHWQDPVGITKEQWIFLLQDDEIVKEKYMQLFKLIYNCDRYRATGGQLAHMLRMPYCAPINSQVGHLGKRIVKTLNIQAPQQKSGKGVNWWHIPFWGMSSRKGFYWILRPELQEAMEELSREEFLEEVPLPEEIAFESHEIFYEGAQRQIYVNSYERNRGVRDQCVRNYGIRCVICGFDFQEKYGAIGKDIIHVHHLKPLHEIGEMYRIDPIKDLRPVCPNCHVIIHRRDPAYSLDEVRAMIEEKML